MIAFIRRKHVRQRSGGHRRHQHGWQGGLLPARVRLLRRRGMQEGPRRVRGVLRRRSPQKQARLRRQALGAVLHLEWSVLANVPRAGKMSSASLPVSLECTQAALFFRPWRIRSAATWSRSFLWGGVNIRWDEHDPAWEATRAPRSYHLAQGCRVLFRCHTVVFGSRVAVPSRRRRRMFFSFQTRAKHLLYAAIGQLPWFG